MMESKLSPMEYKFMEFIWKRPEGAYSCDIFEAFPQAMGTKSATLHHLKKKGYVEMIQVGKQTKYLPLISKSVYDREQMERMLKKNLGVTSLDSLVAMLCGKERLTEEQSRKLNTLVEELREADE